MAEFIGMETARGSKNTDETQSCFITPKNRVIRFLSTIIFSILSVIFIFVNIFPTKAQDNSIICPISITSEGEFGNESSVIGSISSDGRFIVFTSLADNLVNSDTNNSNDLFIYDRLTQKIIRPIESIVEAEISPDGRILTFTKNDSFQRLYLHDLLTGRTLSISDDFWGEPANGPVGIGSISHDGRFVVFLTSADNLFPFDPNSNKQDVVLFDRVTGHLRILSPAETDANSNAVSRMSVLSDDGRTVAFLTFSLDLLGSSDSQGLVFYNRVLDQASIMHLPSSKDDSQNVLIDLDLSEKGNIFAYLLFKKVGNNTSISAMVYNRSEEKEQEIINFFTPLDINYENIFSVSLSNNGKYLALNYLLNSEQYQLSRFDLDTREELIIDQGDITGPINITSGGMRILYNKLVNGLSQVFLWDELGEWMPSYVLAGRVTDATGNPLALVTIEDDRGNKVRTDGNGYLWINGISAGTITLTPSKEGYKFEPESSIFSVESDIKNLSYVYTHEEILKEAEKDLGMPYSRYRGSSGPFHGFNAGYCTDLILDAYKWGVDFNIQFALEMDFKAHPWHFYRWRHARDARRREEGGDPGGPQQRLPHSPDPSENHEGPPGGQTTGRQLCLHVRSVLSGHAGHYRQGPGRRPVGTSRRHAGGRSAGRS